MNTPIDRAETVRMIHCLLAGVDEMLVEILKSIVIMFESGATASLGVEDRCLVCRGAALAHKLLIVK